MPVKKKNSARNKARANKTAPKKQAPKKKTPKKKTPKKKTPKKQAPAGRPKQARLAPAKATAQPVVLADSGAPKAGAVAPLFSLPGDDGAVHTLAEHLGHPVVVYFYPRDDTPGCTIEACDFRDNIARAVAKGAVVLGVSKDSTDSHARFRQKYSLNFPLLSDPELAVHRAYGAWGEKLLYGKPTVGVIRSTFLVGKDGRVARAWPRVKVDGHVDDVLRALDALG